MKVNNIVSMIVPVFNVGKYIGECLDSLLNQTYRNLEIVIIDDGSTDDTGKICDAYAEKDNRIKVYHLPNQGVAKARNAALDVFTGDYVMFVDGDDWIDSDMVEVLYNSLQEHHADMAVCGYQRVWKNRREDHSLTFQTPDHMITVEQCYEYILYHDALLQDVCSHLFKAEIFKDPSVRYVPERTCESVLMITKILERCQRISYVDHNGYYYRQRKTSALHSDANKVKVAIDGGTNYLARSPYFEQMGRLDFAMMNLRKAIAYYSGGYEAAKRVKGAQRKEYDDLRRQLVRQTKKYLGKTKDTGFYKSAVPFLMGNGVYHFMSSGMQKKKTSETGEGDIAYE